MNNIRYGVTTISHGTFILALTTCVQKGLQYLCSVCSSVMLNYYT